MKKTSRQVAARPETDASAADAPAPFAARPIVRSPGLVDEAYTSIRHGILSLRWPPGTRLSIDSLVRELGVSQTPIREAMSMLEAHGLVTKRHMSGYCTAPTLDRKQFENLYEMRLLLEPAAAQRAAGNISDQALASLNRVSQTMGGELRNGSQSAYVRFADADSAFHGIVADCSGNDLFADALNRLHTHLHIFRIRHHQTIKDDAFAEHAAILKALEERDGKAAQRAMRNHIEKSRQRFLPYV